MPYLAVIATRSLLDFTLEDHYLLSIPFYLLGQLHRLLDEGDA